MPTTIIHGDQDATVPIAHAHEMAEGIRNATLHVLPGEGHFANVQVPEKVNPLLANGLGIPEDLVPKGKRTDTSPVWPALPPVVHGHQFATALGLGVPLRPACQPFPGPAVDAERARSGDPAYPTMTAALNPPSPAVGEKVPGG